MKLRRIAEIAAEQAELSKHHYKHGAVIFRQGKVISKGYNETKRGFSGYRGYWEGSLHAEIAALVKSRMDVSGCNILVYRRGRNNSRPCALCMAAIQAAGLKTLFYTQDGEIVKEKI